MDRDMDSVPMLGSPNAYGNPVQPPQSSIRRKPLSASSSIRPPYLAQGRDNHPNYERIRNEPEPPGTVTTNEHDDGRFLDPLTHEDRERYEGRDRYIDNDYPVSTAAGPHATVHRSATLFPGSRQPYPARFDDSKNTSSRESRFRSQKATNDWRPWLLNYTGILILCLLIQYVLYCVAYYFTHKNGYFLIQSSSYDWFFQFGPSFLAVFFKEWCSRISADYSSIAPYLAHNLAMRRYDFNRFGVKLYAVGMFRSMLQNVRLTMIGLCASILILIQSVILVTSDYPVMQAAQLSVPSRDAFLAALTDTSIPALTVPSYFTNQSAHNFDWVAMMTQDGNDVWDSYSIGVLPVRSAHLNVAAESLKGVTSGYSSVLKCQEVKSLVVQMRQNGTSSWDVRLDLTDSNGCRFQYTVEGSPIAVGGNFAMGAVGNDTFTLWKYLEDGNPGNQASATCPTNTQFILAGYMSRADLDAIPADYVNIPVQGTSTWEAVSCISDYREYDDTVLVTYSSDYNVDNGDIQAGSYATPNASVSNTLESAMKRNFIDNNLIYSFGDILNGMTFWGTPAPYKWSSNFVRTPSLNSTPSCDRLTSCFLSGSTGLLWTLLFGVSVPITAFYLPVESWGNISGHSLIGTGQTVWSVSDGALILSGFVHLVLIGFILACGFVRLPGEKLHNRTGLVRSPGTIIAKAELFRTERVRKIFYGMDALEKPEAEELSRQRLRQLSFETRVSRHHNRDVAAIDIQNPSRITEEYRSEVPLTIDKAQLEDLRFAFIPFTLHWTVLALAFAVVLLIFGAGVYINYHNTGYFFWAQAIGVRQSFTRRLVVWSQELLFSLFPTLVLLALRYWWTAIETFFRDAQPYVGLYKALPGRQSVCLKYVNDPDVAVTIKAMRNGHYRLAFITNITFLIKLALALSGGLFVYRESLSTQTQNIKPLQAWRQDIYQIDQTTFSPAVLQSTTLDSILGLGSNAGWQTSTHIFPAVEIGEGQYLMELQGISASLDCREVVASFDLATSEGQLTATVQDDIIGSFEWSNFCQFSEENLNDGVDRTTASLPVIGQCPLKSTNSSTTLSDSTSSTTGTSSSDTSSTSAATTAGLQPLTRPTTSNDLVPLTRPSTKTSSSTTSSSKTSTTAASRTAIPAPSPTMPGTTTECYLWYEPTPGEFCWEIAERYGFNWTIMRQLNPNIDSGCFNLQPYKSYCLDGVPPSRKKRRAVTPDSSGSCTGWKYVPANCTAFPVGRWVIIDAHGSLVSSNGSTIGLNSVDSSTALVCRPQFHQDNVNVTVLNTAGRISITVNGILASQELGPRQWTGGNGLAFGEYFSSGLEQNGFTGRFSRTSSSEFRDGMSLIASSNSTKLTRAFQNIDGFKRTSSNAFGLAFAVATNHSISSDGSTWLLEAVTKSSNATPIASREFINKAFVAPVPLYAIMIILGLYALSLLFVYPSESRRMPLDPRFVANVVASIYDSSVMNEVDALVKQGKDPVESLKNRVFAFGVYRGMSTERRLGIDFEGRVTAIGHDRGGLRRRLNHGFVAEEDAEKQSLASVESREIPELAPCMSPRELEERGDYDVRTYQLRAQDVHQQQELHHGTARETHYAPDRMAEAPYLMQRARTSPTPQKKPPAWWDKLKRRRTYEPYVTVRTVDGPYSTETASDESPGLAASIISSMSSFGSRFKNFLMGPLGRH